MQLGELIAAVEQARAAHPAVAFDFVADSYELPPGADPSASSFALPATPFSRHTGRYCAAPGKVRLEYRLTFSGEGVTQGSRVTRTWNGTLFWEEQGPVRAGAWCSEQYVFDDDADPATISAFEPLLGAADGYLPMDMGRRWLDFARQAPPGRARVTPESLGGIDCARVHLDMPQGAADLWLDPAAGYSVRQAIIRYAVRPVTRARRLLNRLRHANETVSIEKRISAVRVETVGGVAFPVAGRIVTTTRYTDGTRRGDILIVRRKRVRFGEEPAGLRWQPAEGSRLRSYAHPIEYVWRNGALRTAVTAATQREIGAVLQALNAPSHRACLASLGWFKIAAGPAVTSESPASTPDSATCESPVFGTGGLLGLWLVDRLGNPAVAPEKYLAQARDWTYTVTPDQLGRVAREAGLQSRWMTGMSPAGLLASPCPVVLAWRHAVYERRITDYALYLGHDRERFLVWHPGEGLRMVSPGELAAAWNGTGLVVSRDPEDVGPIRRASLFALFPVGLLTFLLGLLAWRIARRRRQPTADGNTAPAPAASRRWKLALTQLAGLAAFSGIMGALWHAADARGLLRDGVAVRLVQASYTGLFVPRLDTGDVVRLVERPGDTQFLDARDAASYQAGHIPGALNLPLGLNAGQWRAALRRIDPGRALVLYCGGSGCKMAEHLAARLAADDYKRIAIFTGGWYAWCHRATDSAPPTPRS
ncbi:MAG: rhodanese-like domain-containing protein [bacterium]|nr:rhodanese-like domain-containing protein [bacterium]